MATNDDFDVESTLGDDDELEIRAAPPSFDEDEDPVPPPEPTPAQKAAAEPTPPPEPKRVGRPRKERQPQAPVIGHPAEPNIDISKKPGKEEWPKDVPSLWMHALEWGRKNGRGADFFLIYVTQMRGNMGQAYRMPVPIHGETVAGSETVSPGEALCELITDFFHIPTTIEACSYQIEIVIRSTGAKVRKSEPMYLDRPEKIERIRQAMRLRAMQEGGMPVSNIYTPGYQMLTVPRNGPFPQTAPTQQQTAPVANTPLPSTGNQYLDQLIEQLRSERENERAAKERLEASLRIREDEIRDLRAPGIPAPPLQDSEDVKQAKLAQMIAQGVMQTLIATGVIKPPGAAQPAAAATPEAQVTPVGSVKTNVTSMEGILDEFDRYDKLFARMKKRFEPEEEEESETVPAVQAVVDGPEKKLKTFNMGGVILPRFDAEDEATIVDKVLGFVGANPNLTRELAGQLLGMVMGKLPADAVQRLLGAVMAQGGQAGAAAASIQAHTNGVAGGGYSPPTA